jgi:hypothetical protein
MRARAAYIRSLGTTSILVVAAILMLGVVGALVGFHGWPEGAVGDTVPSVPLKPAPQPVLSAVRDVREAPNVTRGARLLGDRTATVGLVKEVPVSSPRQIGHPEAYVPGQVAPTPAAQPPAAPANNPDVPPEAVPPTPPIGPPADAQQLQTLVTQLLGTVPLPPPPPAAPQGDEPLQVGIPLVGLTVSVPPATSR